MATTTYTYVCQTIGQVWSLMVQKWVDYVVNTAGTWTAGALGTSGLPAGKAWYIQIVIGADTYIFRYVALDIHTSSVRIPVQYIAQSPGWRAAPTIVEIAYGARNTAANWLSTMCALRGRIWADCTGISVPTYVGVTSTAAGATYVVTTYTTQISVIYTSIVDVMVVTGMTFAGSQPLLGNVQMTDGVGAGPTYPAYIAADTAPIVQALQNIAAGETQVSFNNGAYTVLVRSGDQVTIP